MKIRVKGLNKSLNSVAGLLRGASLLAVLLYAWMPAASQNRAPAADPAAEKPTPRTPDGHPDLNAFWNNTPAPNGALQFERASDGSILFDFATTFNDNKTCVNLDPACQAPNQPPYKPEYMAKVRQIASTMNAGTTALDPISDCKPLGVPRAGGAMRIVQTPDVVAILYEGAPSSTYRVVYMNSKHPDDLDTSYMGDSRGHWEGDTLVVDVVGLSDETWLGGDVGGRVKFTSIHSDKEHVIERWTRKGDVMTYEATVEDPVMFTKPWVTNPRRVRVAAPTDVLLEDFCAQLDKAHYVPPSANDTGCNYRCSDATTGK